jgi:hypothetical protein
MPIQVSSRAAMSRTLDLCVQDDPVTVCDLRGTKRRPPTDSYDRDFQHAAVVFEQEGVRAVACGAIRELVGATLPNVPDSAFHCHHAQMIGLDIFQDCANHHRLLFRVTQCGTAQCGDQQAYGVHFTNGRWIVRGSRPASRWSGTSRWSFTRGVSPTSSRTVGYSRDTSARTPKSRFAGTPRSQPPSLYPRVMAGPTRDTSSKQRLDQCL